MAAISKIVLNKIKLEKCGQKAFCDLWETFKIELIIKRIDWKKIASDFQLFVEAYRGLIMSEFMSTCVIAFFVASNP